MEGQLPGTDLKTFKIKLSPEFNKNKVLQDQNIQRTLEVVTKPIHKYHKWYHKVLNKLTFDTRFKEYWEHQVILEPIKNI